MRNVVYSMENKNGSPQRLCGVSFILQTHPHPAKSLEAGRVLEENPQRHWKTNT